MQRLSEEIWMPVCLDFGQIKILNVQISDLYFSSKILSVISVSGYYHAITIQNLAFYPRYGDMVFEIHM